MPLGTLDRSPPPFFRQGPSALTKLVLCAALALFLMVADTRFEVAQTLRAVIATALHPVQRALLAPVELWHGGAGYLKGLNQAVADADAAQRRLAAQAEQAARATRLDAENARLRDLLDLRPALRVRSLAAEVLYEATDPFSRKIVIDRGTTHGVVPGAPVINEQGVLGQVTRAFPLTSEVTLLTDRSATIPVLNPRTQQRAVAFGGAALELRFMPDNADVQVDDLLLTSGVDGVYPPGLPVARVRQVERRAESGFARIDLVTAAAADGARHVLVLEPLGLQLPARPAVDAPSAAPREPAARRRVRK